MFGVDPFRAISGEATGGDEHVDVGMEEHGAGPGVEHGKSADARANIAGIGGEPLQGIGGGFHRQAVDFFRMSARQGTQLRRQGEGRQEIGTR